MLKRFPHFTQLDSRDCGPACLQIISKHYNKYFSLDELREKFDINKEGVSVYEICEAAESIGLKALPVKTSLDKLIKDIPLPCIAYWRSSHFIVVYKTTNSHIYVSDPAIGLVKYTRRDFLRNWLERTTEKQRWRNGILVALEPTDKFNDIKPIQSTPNFSNIVRYLAAHIKPYRKQAMQLILTMIVISILQIAFPMISQSIIDTGVATKDFNFINLLLIANIVLIISTSIGNWIRQSINVHMAARVKISLLSNYIMKLLGLPITFFEKKIVGDILQRSLDYERLQTFLLDSAFSIILAILNVLIFGAILLAYSPFLCIALIVGMLLHVFWVLMFWGIKKRMDTRFFALQAKNNSHWVELLTNIQEIKNNNFEKGKRWKWEQLQVKLYEVSLRMLNVTQLETLGGNLISSLRDMALTFYSVHLVISGDLTFGGLFAVQFILGQMRAPVADIIRFITSYQVAYISFLRMNEVNQVPEEQDDETLNNTVFPQKKTLSVRNVSYRYNNNSSLVLNNVNLEIPEGKVTAIVGASGSGKSTLLKVLMRLYKPLAGELFIGETNADNVSLRLWRDKIGTVNQESTVFKDSIKNNIILGYKFEHDRFMHAVRSSNILNDIEMLPKGFNTVMGENGQGLSEGQKQRVIIARALYKNPDYLFLDEATNSLDSINESTVIKNLDGEYKGRTVVIVSHRLSTIKNADQIVVIHQGRVVQIGKHDVLMGVKVGIYAQLFEKQAELG